MLLHELAHLLRRDQWVRAFQNLAQVIFFFWPPVRLVSRQIERFRELACDQLALEHCELSPGAYARVLVEARCGALGPAGQLAALEMSSQVSRLERRIDLVLTLNRRRSVRWAALTLGCAGALALSGPALAVDAGVGPGAGTIDRADLEKVVFEHRAEVRACFEAELRFSPAFVGSLEYVWEVSPTGTVTDGCRGESHFSPELTPEALDSLSRCIRTAIWSWSFPRPRGGGPVNVAYPFTFSRPAVVVPERPAPE
jgi:hypothetical protein